MSRVAISDVKAIFPATTVVDGNITACITSANVMTNNGPALSTNPALGSDELFQIELYLACHFLDLQDPIGLRVKIGDADQRSFPESVTTAWGQNLKLTVWGQQALAFDRSGALAKLGLMKGSYRPARREDSNFYTPRLTKS